MIWQGKSMHSGRIPRCLPSKSDPGGLGELQYCAYSGTIFPLWVEINFTLCEFLFHFFLIYSKNIRNHKGVVAVKIETISGIEIACPKGRRGGRLCREKM